MRKFIFFGLLLSLVFSGCDCGDTAIRGNLEDAGIEDGGDGGILEECPQGMIQIRGKCHADPCDINDRNGCCPGWICDKSSGNCRPDLITCSEEKKCEYESQECREEFDGSFCLLKSCQNLQDCQNQEGEVQLQDGYCFNQRCLNKIPCGGKCEAGQVCIPDADKCVETSGEGCDQSCLAGKILVLKNPQTMTGVQCSEIVCECQNLPPVAAGLVGSHSAITAIENKIFVSAYDKFYGDLVLLEYDRNGELKSAEYIDGVPEDKPEGHTDGRRGGITGMGSQVGQFTSITTDSQGNPIIAYYDPQNYSLKFAFMKDNKWQKETIDKPQDPKGGRGKYTAMAYDSKNDTLYIVYYLDRGLNIEGKVITGLLLAEKKGTESWKITVVDSMPKPGLSMPPCDDECQGDEICTMDDTGLGKCSLEIKGCLDQDQKSICQSEEVCIKDDKTEVCKPKRKANTLKGLPLGLGLFASITLHPHNNQPLIAYYDSVNGNLKLAYRTATGFQTLVVDGAKWKQDSQGNVIKDKKDQPVWQDTGDYGFHNSIAVNSQGRIAVATFDFSRRYLVLIYADQVTKMDINMAQSKRLVVDNGLDKVFPISWVGPDVTLRFDSDDKPYLLYQDATYNNLKLANPAGTDFWKGDWKIETIADQGANGFWADMVIDKKIIFINNYLIKKKSKGPRIDKHQVIVHRLP